MYFSIKFLFGVEIFPQNTSSENIRTTLEIQNSNNEHVDAQQEPIDSNQNLVPTILINDQHFNQTSDGQTDLINSNQNLVPTLPNIETLPINANQNLVQTIPIKYQHLNQISDAQKEPVNSNQNDGSTIPINHQQLHPRIDTPPIQIDSNQSKVPNHQSRKSGYPLNVFSKLKINCVLQHGFALGLFCFLIRNPKLNFEILKKVLDY